MAGSLQQRHGFRRVRDMEREIYPGRVTLVLARASYPCTSWP